MKYSKEFKEEAVKLSDEVGTKKACQQLGLPYFTVADWRKDRKSYEKHISELSPSEQEKRIIELERELDEIKKANEILKDTLGFFAKDRKK